jgi:hypothetical protein
MRQELLEVLEAQRGAAGQPVAGDGAAAVEALDGFRFKARGGGGEGGGGRGWDVSCATEWELEATVRRTRRSTAHSAPPMPAVIAAWVASRGVDKR